MTPSSHAPNDRRGDDEIHQCGQETWVDGFDYDVTVVPDEDLYDYPTQAKKAVADTDLTAEEIALATVMYRHPGAPRALWTDVVNELLLRSGPDGGFNFSEVGRM